MAIGKSPPRNRKAAVRPQEFAPSPAASRSRAAPRLAAPKSKGRNSKSTNASPLTVDIPTTPFLANFLSPLDVAAIQNEFYQEGLQGSPKRLSRSTATSPKRSVRELTVPRSPKVESQLYTNRTPWQSPNAASPTKLGADCSEPRAVAGNLAKQQRKALVLQQILQEQQALLLEDSPAYLAALSQDDKAGFLLNSAEAHDWQLQGLGSDGMAHRNARKMSPAATGMQHSSVSRDAALAGMAVKVMQLESMLNSKQADLQRMGDSGQAWVQEACCLRDAVSSTLAALDAADDEGRCLKAEVEILRSYARQNATALAQLVPQTEASALHQKGATGSDLLQTHSPGQTLPTQQQHWQQQWQDQQQQQQQQGEPHGSGSATEMELAAVEQGLSALDEQISAAALRLTGSESAVFHDAVAERSRAACMPSQQTDQQAACTHTYQLGHQPGVYQHNSGQHQQGLDVQQHNAGEHHAQFHCLGGESQASLLEGLGSRHQAVHELSTKRMLVEEHAARQQGCGQPGREDKTVQRAQQQPVVLPRQQPSEMYHLPQPTDDLSSGPAKHDMMLPPNSCHKLGQARLHHQEAMLARHKQHSHPDRAPDQEQTAAALAGHEHVRHVRPGLARQASQRSVDAQGEASSAALLQSIQSSSQGSSQVARHVQQPQRATSSQQRLLETHSQQRQLEIQSQQPQRAEDEGHEMELWHTQKDHDSQPQRAQQDAQLDKQAQHAQHSMQSGFTSSMTLSARIRQHSSSCSAVLHSPEATTQMSFHASVSPGKRATPPADSCSQLSIKASMSTGQQHRLPEQLHKHALPQQLPQQRLQLQSTSGRQHLLTTDHKGQTPDSQGQLQQECVSLPGQTIGTTQVRSPSRTNSTIPPAIAPQADAAAPAATATCRPHIHSPPAEGPVAAEQASAGGEDSGAQQQSGSRSGSAEAMSQGLSIVDDRQQHEASTKPTQLSVRDAAATCIQTQMVSSCGGSKGSCQPVSRIGSMDRLQKLMLLTKGAQQEQLQHQVSGAGAFRVNRSMSRTASMAVKRTSSCSDSAAGGPQGQSSQTQGSSQRGVSCIGSINSQPQLAPSRADSASSQPVLGIFNSGMSQQGLVLQQQGTLHHGSVANSQQAESLAKELLLSHQQSISHSIGTSSSQHLAMPAVDARSTTSEKGSVSCMSSTRLAVSYAGGSQAPQLQHSVSSPGGASSAQQPTSHTCCSSSNSAQQAVSHAIGIAFLREQSQVALGVQPSYDDLSREVLEEDNCRLRYALAAIELQLGVLRNQQVEGAEVSRNADAVKAEKQPKHDKLSGLQSPGLNHVNEVKRLQTDMGAAHQQCHTMEATQAAELADLSLQLSTQQDITHQLESALHASAAAAAVKDANIAEASTKLHRLTQQLASHERASESAAAAREAAIADLTRQLALQEQGSQAAEAARQTAAADLTQQLQATQAGFQAASDAHDAEVGDLKRQLDAAQTSSANSLAAKDGDLNAVTQQLEGAQQSVGSLTAKIAAQEGRLAELSQQISTQQSDMASHLAAHQEVVKQLEAREQSTQAQLVLVSESNSKHASLRQQAMAALEAQLVELTQQLSASEQSQMQLEHKLELQRSSSKAEIEQAQAGLRQASDKLAAAQQLLQEIESSSGAQELQLTQQLSSHTQQLAAAQHEVQQLKKKVQSQEEELRCAHRSGKDLQGQLVLQTQTGHAAQKDATKLKGEVAMLRRQVGESEGEVQVLLGQLAIQSKLAVTSSKELTRLHDLIRKHENQLRLYEEQMKLSAQQAALLKQQLSEAQCQASAAEKQVREEQMQLQRLERRLATLQAQAEDQTSQTRSWRASSEQLQWQIADLQRKLRDSEQRSTLWARRAGAAEARVPAQGTAARKPLPRGPSSISPALTQSDREALSAAPDANLEFDQSKHSARQDDGMQCKGVHLQPSMMWMSTDAPMQPGSQTDLAQHDHVFSLRQRIADYQTQYQAQNGLAVL
ncbi:hypothetical protein WJX77_001412 [Trebouxia sp. C0004]